MVYSAYQMDFIRGSDGIEVGRGGPGLELGTFSQAGTQSPSKTQVEIASRPILLVGTSPGGSWPSRGNLVCSESREIRATS